MVEIYHILDFFSYNRICNTSFLPVCNWWKMTNFASQKYLKFLTNCKNQWNRCYSCYSVTVQNTVMQICENKCIVN